MDAQAVHMGTIDQLLVADDDVIRRRRRLGRRQRHAGPADVVDPHHQHHGGGVRLSDYVAVEMGQRIGTHPIGKDALAGDRLVHHRDIAHAFLLQPFG
jgi:hypothetical protein